jgi:hypothetical protein
MHKSDELSPSVTARRHVALALLPSGQFFKFMPKGLIACLDPTSKYERSGMLPRFNYAALVPPAIGSVVEDAALQTNGDEFILIQNHLNRVEFICERLLGPCSHALGRPAQRVKFLSRFNHVVVRWVVDENR